MSLIYIIKHILKDFTVRDITYTSPNRSDARGLSTNSFPLSYFCQSFVI